MLKVKPIVPGVAIFGITTLDHDVTYDDLSGDGPITYRARRGYTAFNVQTSSTLSVDNSEAHGLMAEYPADGMTAAGIAAGWYDSAAFVQYLVNYMDLTMGHCEINSGQVGQVTNLDDLTVKLEMRSLTQILKQTNLIEQTSVTCRADFGDNRCKKPLTWWNATVTAVGVESDRTFSVNSFSKPMTGVTILVGNGTAVTAQLLDENGAPVTSNFSVTSITSNGAPLVAGTDYTISSSGLVTLATAPASGVVIAWSGAQALSPAGTSAGQITHVLFGVGDGSTKTFQLVDTAGIPVTSGYTITNVSVGSTTIAPGTGYTVSSTGLVTLTNAPASGASIYWSGTIPLSPNGYFAPGVANWLTGTNAGRQCDVEGFDAATNTVTLGIPVGTAIAVGDTLRIRRDCDKSWQMCKDTYSNTNNMRAEPLTPRGNTNDLQAPSQV